MGLDEYRSFVRTIGGSQIDTPGGKWPDSLYMKWMSAYKQSCVSCAGCASTDNEPYCVFNCLNGALSYGDFDDPKSPAVVRMEELRDKGFRTSDPRMGRHPCQRLVRGEGDLINES